MNEELKIDTLKKEDTNDYKELYGKLRNQINSSRDSYRTNLINTKDTIESFRTQLEILTTKKAKLEGAIEASDALLKSFLPSNNKK